ncbi:MAG: flagellar hook-basal body complex protein FliE [Hyphomicrobiales bacterium]|nr:MAG: flagellar hook-basal body complex protein FliE [Hyphomicrobiales bacterium]
MSIPASVALNAYASAAQAGSVSQGAGAAKVALGGGESSFGNALQNVMDGMMEASKKGETEMANAVSNQGNLVDVVTAVSEAEATVQTVVAIRDKVVTAYQEILRMPI